MLNRAHKREQMLREELAYIRGKLPLEEEPELPLKLQGDLLKQRLLAEENSYQERPFPLKKLAVMACCMIFVLTLGWSSLFPRLTAEPMDASLPGTASLEAAPMERTMALDLEEEAALIAEEELSQLKILTYPAAAEKTLEQIRRIYPELTDEDIHVLVDHGDQYTVLRLLVGEEYRSIAILCDSAEVTYHEDGYYLLSDAENGLSIKLHEETLALLQSSDR